MKKITRQEFIKTAICLYAGASLSPIVYGCSQDSENGDTLKDETETTLETGQPPSQDRHENELTVVSNGNPKDLVNKAVEGLGGIDRFVKKGDRVVVKPNILYAQNPKFAATTNPDVIEAIVSLCVKAGAKDVTILDRPTSGIGVAYKETGIEQAARRAGGRTKILSDRNYAEKKFPQGKALTKWPLVKDIFEADVFINVPIAKDHDLAGLTLSMKNLMGIMGSWRSFMHTDFPTKIVDLNTLVKPDLIILDAYRILMRNGPTGGDLDDVKNVKKVVAGTNAVQVDAWTTQLFDRQPDDFEFLIEAQNRGLASIDIKNYKINNLTL